MTELQLANVFQNAVIIFLGSIVVFKLVPDSRLDSFRQNLFAIRDEMFDFAAHGNISFEDPAYRLLRTQMNGLIRYGHQITFFRSILSALIRRISGSAEPRPWNEAWEKAIANVEDGATKAKMEEFHNRAVLLAVKRLLLGSPLLWIPLVLTALVLLAQGAASGLRQLLSVASEKVLQGPLDHQLLEELAVVS